MDNFALLDSRWRMAVAHDHWIIDEDYSVALEGNLIHSCLESVTDPILFWRNSDQATCSHTSCNQIPLFPKENLTNSDHAKECLTSLTFFFERTLTSSPCLSSKFDVSHPFPKEFWPILIPLAECLTSPGLSEGILTNPPCFSCKFNLTNPFWK